MLIVMILLNEIDTVNFSPRLLWCLFNFNFDYFGFLQKEIESISTHIYFILKNICSDFVRAYTH